MNISLLPKAPLRVFVFACILTTMLLEKHCFFLAASFHMTSVLFFETFNQNLSSALSCF